MNNISHILKLFLIFLVCILALVTVVGVLAWVMISFVGPELAGLLFVLTWSAGILTIYLRGQGY